MKEDILDIHGMVEHEAIKVIEKHIAQLPKTCERLIIVHGYRDGQTLKDMVASPYKIRSKRVKRRRYSQNPGETILELYT